MERLSEPDEELLEEYEWVRDHVPDDAIPRLDPNESEEVWRRAQEKRSRP